MLQKYIHNLNRLYQTGNAREHSYRGDLQELLNSIIDNKDIVVTNEPARIVGVGAPDFSISKKDIPIGYIEAKDIDKNLESKEYKEQFNRYIDALDNLIITNYLDFYFYKDGNLVQKISIGTIENNQIVALEENFDIFIDAIKDFSSYVSKTITNPSQLAKLMAAKARLLQDVIERAIISDEESLENNSLKEQMEAFKRNIIHDITPKSFADIYAQTIAYGLFTARLHDTTLQDFSRSEAQNLIPKSNPFLRGLFNYIGGVDCDDRLVWIIDSLAEVFLATNIRDIFKNYKKDPIIHFYETFLGEYDSSLRKARGVWYTPLEVVDFIVRSVDEVLKAEFSLEEGLIDDSKVTIKVESPNVLYTKDGKRKKDQSIKKEFHKVQILDPATGTGTFLAQTIKFIKENFWGGSWSSYVQNSLIPRLNGFELLMASYAMAHLKLDMLLMESGYKATNNDRLNIYLTNSLESYHEDSHSLFSAYLAQESKAADRIKKDTPVMVVMGNPPYSVSSSNKSEWIENLIKDYKKDLNEKKINLDDDYIKFIRYGQHYIDKNGEGIVAYISNNSFLDGLTHRQMRKSLLESFDKIYILDLHGNSRKKETAPDGSKDENVFDIMQGVSINIFIKTSNSKKLAKVYHYDLYGKRKDKYNFLDKNSLNSVNWQKIETLKPNYFFVPKDFALQEEYDKGFKIDELFNIFSSGIETQKDSLLIKFNEKELEVVKNDILYNEDKIRRVYKIKDSRDWKLDIARNDLQKAKIVDIAYRPFDLRKTLYSGTTKGIMAYPRNNVMKHMLRENVGLVCKRGFNEDIPAYGYVSNKIIDRRYWTRAGMQGAEQLFPLYLYEENTLTNNKIPNFNQDIIKKIEESLSLNFKPFATSLDTFNELDLFDYIYAQLHSPSYREKYKEFLKIDFPKVPYPNPKTFWQYVELGRALRKIHLLEDDSLNARTIEFLGEGSTKIENKLNKKDTTIKDDIVTIHLNKDFAITNIPLKIWNFYIGGYQPAQKWLKDRVGKELSRSDIKHYNKIINALLKTDEIMQKIDEV